MWEAAQAAALRNAVKWNFPSSAAPYRREPGPAWQASRYAGGMAAALSPMPSNGLCVCGAVPFFMLSGRVGQAGHFHCRRCGRCYRMADLGWTPGVRVSEDPSDWGRG
jgi:hypothetical protein